MSEGVETLGPALLMLAWLVWALRQSGSERRPSARNGGLRRHEIGQTWSPQKEGNGKQMEGLPGKEVEAERLEALEENRSESLTKHVLVAFEKADSEKKKATLLRRAVFVMSKRHEFN